MQIALFSLFQHFVYILCISSVCIFRLWHTSNSVHIIQDLFREFKVKPVSGFKWNQNIQAEVIDILALKMKMNTLSIQHAIL